MKKILLSFVFIFILSFIGCSNLQNTTVKGMDLISDNVIETPIPTPVPTIDPLVKIQDGDFVMYFDGTNNFMDDMEGYEKVESVPEVYNSYEMLLNHSLDYKNEMIEDYSTSYISYNNIATLENANEVEYMLNDYKINTIVPIEISENNSIYENETFDETTNFYRLYSISQDENAVYYNCVTKLGNNVDINSFLSKFQQQNYEDWSFFLADIFVPVLNDNNEPNVTFASNENFVTMYLDAFMDITYFEQPYKGLLIINIDKYDGTFIYTFIGYPENVLLNDDINDVFSKTNLLNSIRNRYFLEYMGESRKGCT